MSVTDHNFCDRSRKIPVTRSIFEDYFHIFSRSRPLTM